MDLSNAISQSFIEGFLVKIVLHATFFYMFQIVRTLFICINNWVIILKKSRLILKISSLLVKNWSTCITFSCISNCLIIIYFYIWHKVILKKNWVTLNVSSSLVKIDLHASLFHIFQIVWKLHCFKLYLFLLSIALLYSRKARYYYMYQIPC